MLIVEDLQGHYADSLEYYCGYDRFSEKESDVVFFHGIGCLMNSQYKQFYQSYKIKMFMNYEHPCAWYGDVKYAQLSADIDGFFDKIYTVCPYTATWINEIRGVNKFEMASFPFNKNNMPKEKKEKEFDVLYWGGIHSNTHQEIIDVISDYKYNFITLGFGHWELERLNRESHAYIKYITKQNIPRKEMWSLLNKTKINVIANMLWLNPQQISNIKKLKDWEKNEAFSHLNDGILPQYKTRVIESAANHCLMLVKKDSWNVIENWFDADIDFVYYESEETLGDKISEIINDWDSYEKIVENAYQKVLSSYTIEKFIQRMDRDALELK